MNANKLRDAAEAALAGFAVYLDQNRNGARDANEAFTIANGNGDYSFTGLAAGTYYLNALTPNGWQLTSPMLTSVTLSQSTIGTVNVPTQPSSTLIGLDDLRTDPRFAQADGKGYSIVIIDTGVESTHSAFGPDLDNNNVSDRIVYRADFNEYMDPAGATVDDTTGHGTAVAGVAAGANASYPGIAPGVNIISLKVAGGGIGFNLPMQRALQWTIDNAERFNVVAINMSVADGNNNYLDGAQFPALSSQFATLASMGVISVAAAGNLYGQFNTPGSAYPAADPNVISVGGVYPYNVGTNLNYGNNTIDYTTGPDRIISYSQRRPDSVFAPGSALMAASRGGSSGGFSGTSAASPHVAGAAVVAQQLADLILGRRLSVAEFRTLLNSSGDTIFDGDDENDSVTNTQIAYKRLNVYALAEAVWSLGASYSRGHVVTVGDSDDVAGFDFGERVGASGPAAPMLDASSDTGWSNRDGVTRINGANGKLVFVVPKTIAGSTVKLYLNGVQAATATGGAGVTWITLPGRLEDGQYAITATQTIIGQPESTPSAASTLVIDTGMLRLDAPDLIAADDSGISSTDNNTNVRDLTFNLGPAAYYTLYRNGQRLTYSLDMVTALEDTDPVPDGQYSYYAVGVDLAGNVTTSATVYITRDTTAWPSGPGVDAAFGNNNGFAKFHSGTGAFGSAVAVRGDGKVIVGGETNTNGQYPQVVRLNANGTVDTSFGVNGYFTHAASGAGGVVDVIALPNDQVLVSAMFNNQARIFRLTSSGTLDTTFGTNGFVSLGTSGGVAKMIHRMSDGRIVASFGSSNTVYVARFTANGAPDPTFNNGNPRSVFIGEQTHVTVDGVAVATNGSIVVVGRSADWKSQYLLKITSTGAIDTGFKPGGYAFTAVSGTPHAIAGVAMQDDGKIVIAATGNSGTGSGEDTLLTRYNTNGTLDSTFGVGGKVAANYFSESETVKDLVLDAQGRLLVAYSAYAPTVMRFNTDGTPDTSFGPAGAQSLATGQFGGANGLGLASDGTIYVAGSWQYGVSGYYYIVSKLRPSAGAAPAMVLQPGSDTGTSNSDGITADRTPTFNLPTLPAGHYYRVFANGVQISENYHSGGTFTAATLADGSYAFSVIAIDAAGNASSPSDALNVTIQDDTTAPDPLTGVITPVSPDPRTTAVGSITVNFTNAVTGFTTARLSLTRNGSAVALTGVTLSTADNKTFTINGLTSLTGTAGGYALTLAGGSIIQDSAGQTLPGDIVESWTMNAVPTSPPAAPSGIAGTVVSGNRIDVRWTDNANNETGFEIQRSAVYNFLDPTNVTVNTPNLTSYSDTTLSPNTYYYFRVRSLNAAGPSAWSGSVKLKTSKAGTTPTVPAMPTGPGATANSSSQITVNWTDASNNETGFRIQRSSNSTFSDGLTEFTVGAGVTSFVNTGLAANTTYYYRVQSYNGTGPSAYTTGVNATTQPVVTPTAPAIPTAPNATANSSSQITVTWADASNNETGFRIQRSTNSTFTTGLAEFTVGAGVTSFVNTGLTANTTYYYRVQSYNAVGPSAYTSGVDATTQPAPTGGTGPLTAPNGLAVTIARTSALVEWNDNSNNESGWEIQISTVYNFTAGTTQTITVPTIDAESFNVQGLTANTWYYFRVRAVNTTNVSGWTGSIKLKTLK